MMNVLNVVEGKEFVGKLVLTEMKKEIYASERRVYIDIVCELMQSANDVICAIHL